MTPLQAEADHIIVAALSLKQGSEWIESRLGVAPQSGGRHLSMGTHNALLSLGPRFFIEVIAVDPEGTPPARARWFDLDDPRLNADLKEGPQLIHWAARTRDVRAASARVPDLGPPIPMQRGDLRWLITVPGDGHRPGRGLVPTVIEWPDARHPADGLRDAGLRLVALGGEHPEPASVRTAIAQLGLSEAMKVTFGASPRIVAMIRTPRGVVAI